MASKEYSRLIHFNFWNLTVWKQMTPPGDSPDLGLIWANLTGQIQTWKYGD